MQATTFSYPLPVGTSLVSGDKCVTDWSVNSWLTCCEEESSKGLVAHVSELYQVYRGLLATILERGQQTGQFHTRVQPIEDAALIMATLNGVLVQQIVEPDNINTIRGLLTRAKQVIDTHLTHQSGSPDTARRGFGRSIVDPDVCDAAPLER